MHKLLITGITGKSGRHLIDAFAHDPSFVDQHEIRTIVRDPQKLASLNSIRIPFEIAVGSMQDLSALRDAMDNMETVLHIAGIHNSPQVVDAAIASGTVRRIILVHTTGIYSGFKEAGELYRQIEERVLAEARSASIDVTILRPTMIYGSVDDGNIVVFIKLIDRFPIMPVVGLARAPIQPVYQGDLGKAYLQVLKADARTHNRHYVLSGERPISQMGMYRSIAKALGKRRLFIPVPTFIATTAAKVVNWMSKGRHDYRERVLRMTESRAFEHEDATRDFGFTPIPWEQGLAIEVREYLQNQGRSA